MKKKKIPYTVLGKTLNYEMPQELDHHVAKQLCRELDRLIEAHAITELILDFAQTEFMDSSGIGVVIGRSRMMRFREGNIYVVNMGERVETIFRAAGLDKIVEITEGQV